MQERTKQARFEEAVLPHLDAAYNVARWLTRNDQDAEDMVQEAVIRALKSFGGFYGLDGRAWLLTIVRNTCYTWLQRNRAHDLVTLPFEDEVYSPDCDAANPETLLLHSADTLLLRQAVEGLPLAFREVIVLRELEGLSYKDIAMVVGIPLGTVMSRLARARQRLLEQLSLPINKAY
ncbi:MAG: sigma-70 family RNA polymerase sigma factor [Chloroflexota bacterium]|nr:sigma-70 family RNA polymerase sigma factor [Chloroflexota bacterium]